MASFAEPAEVGRVTWSEGMVAVLLDDGTWRVPGPGPISLLAEGLTRKYAAWRSQRPADGQPGALILHDWAAQVKGKVTLADPAEVTRRDGLLTPALLHALAVAQRGMEALEAKQLSNPFGLPAGTKIRQALKRFFRRQLTRIFANLPREPLAAIPAVLDVTDWSDEMTSAMTPLIRPLWDKAGKRLYGELGLDPHGWEVVSPELAPRIREQAFHFVASTNASTTLRLQAAHEELRKALAEGLVEQGETLDFLTKKVRGIYTGLSKDHARLIASTESSRAVHLAQEAAAHESGVVAGWEVLISGDACSLCRKIVSEAKRVRLGQSFAVIGNHEYYSDIKMPPFHPRCNCTATTILLPEYGGPEHVEWAETLQQPQEGLEE